jgi:hypothetical protein
MGLFSKLFGRKKKDEEFLSIVYLLRRHRKVDEPKMRAALAGLIQSVFKMDAPPETHVKEVSESGAGLVIEGQPFVVIGVAEPYTTTTRPNHARTSASRTCSKSTRRGSPATG